METEQDPQVVSINSKQSQQLQSGAVGEQDEFNSSPQKGLNLRPLLRIIQRNLLLIGGLTLVGAGISAYLSMKEGRVYAGNFRLLVEPVTTEARLTEPAALTNLAGGVPNRDVFSLDYPTQFEILQSPKMLEAILERVRSRYPQVTPLEFRKGLLLKRIGENAYEQTKIIEVSYKGSSPEVTSFVLKTIADKYLKYSLDERKTRIGEGVKFIDSQLPALRQRVESLQLQRQQLQQQYKLNDPKAQGGELLTQLQKIESEQLEAEMQLQEQKTLYSSLQQQLELTPNEAIAASALSQDPQYQQLLAKLKEIEGQIAVEAARFQSANPYLQSLLRKQENLQALLNHEMQRILGQNLVGTARNPQVMTFQNQVRIDLIGKLVTANNQIKALESRLQPIREARNSVALQVKQFPAIARKYTDLEQQLEISSRTLDQLLTQRETLRVQAAQNQVPWELISKPQLTTEPNSTKPMPEPRGTGKKVMTGVGGGLVLGLVLAIILEKLRNIFYVPDDIKDAIELPLLGLIPAYKDRRSSRNSHPNIYLSVEEAEGNQSASLFLEAFDSLYTSIRFLSPTGPVHSLAVCSPTSGDGKSTIALHLAQAAALVGQRVLLVDANLHSPSLHAFLDLPNTKGLCDLLYNKLTANEAIVRSPLIDNLFILPSGQPLPGCSRRLGSAQMQYLIEEFKAKFDLVIYDTPHLKDLKDANFLAAHTDGVLMVIALRKTKHSVVKQVLEELNTYGISCLGIVANNLKKKSFFSGLRRSDSKAQSKAEKSYQLRLVR